MSDTDDTDFLILLPPDFFYVHSESEDSNETDLIKVNYYTSGSFDVTEMGQYSYENTLQKSKHLPHLRTSPLVANIKSSTSESASDTVSLAELDSLQDTNSQHTKTGNPPIWTVENVSNHSGNLYTGGNKTQAVLKEEVDMFLEIIEKDMNCHEEIFTQPLNRKVVLELSDITNCSDAFPKETRSSVPDLKHNMLSQDESEVIQPEEMVIQQMNCVPANIDTGLKKREIDSMPENMKPGLTTLSQESLSNDNAVNVYFNSEVFPNEEVKIIIEAQEQFKSGILGSCNAELTKFNIKNETDGAAETVLGTNHIEKTCTTKTPERVKYQKAVGAVVRGHSPSLSSTSLDLSSVGHCDYSGGKCLSSCPLPDMHLNNEVSISSTVHKFPIHILQGTANIRDNTNIKKDSQDIYISCEQNQCGFKKLNDHLTTSADTLRINDKEKHDRHQLQKEDCIGGLGFQPAVPEKSTHSTDGSNSTCINLATTRYICHKCGAFAGCIETWRYKGQEDNLKSGGCESVIQLQSQNIEHQQAFVQVADSDGKAGKMILALQNDYRNIEALYRALEEKNRDLECELLKEKHDHHVQTKKLEEKEHNLAAAEIGMKELRTQLESSKAEVLALRKELQSKLKEEEIKFHLMDQEQLRLQALLNQSKCKEKSLQEDIRNIMNQKEKVKSELHRFYQDQLEKVVCSKLSEFQQRLDHTEAALFNEMRKKEQEALNLTSKKLKEIAQQHSEEIRLMEKRHNEELKLCQLELSRRVQTTCLLKAKLQNLREENKVIVQKLLYMMETCQEAMKIMEVYEATTPIQKKGSSDENL